MSRVRVSAEAPFPAARFVSALTDFGPDRARIWGASSPGLFELHELGDTWADVTEGTSLGGIWQRYRYDWSTPLQVRLTVLESNAFGVGSYWLYTLADLDGGRCRIDLEIHRVPTTAKGRLFDVLLKPVGRFYFGRDLRRSINRLAS